MLNVYVKGWKTVDGNFIDSDLAKTIFKSHQMILLYLLLLLSLSHIFKYLIPCVQSWIGFHVKQICQWHPLPTIWTFNLPLRKVIHSVSFIH